MQWERRLGRNSEKKFRNWGRKPFPCYEGKEPAYGVKGGGEVPYRPSFFRGYFPVHNGSKTDEKKGSKMKREFFYSYEVYDEAIVKEMLDILGVEIVDECKGIVYNELIDKADDGFDKIIKSVLDYRKGF